MASPKKKWLRMKAAQVAAQEAQNAVKAAPVVETTPVVIPAPTPVAVTPVAVTPVVATPAARERTVKSTVRRATRTRKDR
jgi:hypothetical protein